MPPAREFTFGFGANGYFENAEKLEALKRSDPSGKQYEAARKQADQLKERIDHQIEKLGSRFTGYPLSKELQIEITTDLREEDKAMAAKRGASAGSQPAAKEEALSGAAIPKELVFKPAPAPAAPKKQ